LPSLTLLLLSLYIHPINANAQQLGLYDLRRNVSIVPQNPVLFSGTIRRNLDPFAQCNEAQVWEALDKCDLKTTVMQLPGKLDHEVSEYGDNFSAGQRQLLCLSRAMLQSTRLLLLDEATSSVDFDTDQVVQDTIRASFKNTTILTIAHRINTVIDNDRILVLDNGNIAEYDRPANLLANPNSALAKIVGNSRAGMLARLEADGQL
jgi:ATP-binding cassette subfamily C (CFTR/MRP) protein 1